MDGEKAWLKQAMQHLTTEIAEGEAITRASFQANLETLMLDPSALISLLSLFTQKADTQAMIKHGMNIIKSLTVFLNPRQIFVMACNNCPVFTKAKYLKWTRPTTQGDHKFAVMFGGLHIEMAVEVA